LVLLSTVGMCISAIFLTTIVAEGDELMNQIKIVKFISSQRRKNNLTQANLTEKLGITDRAVSKWERGKGLPDTSHMLDLCEILGISKNFTELKNQENL